MNKEQYYLCWFASKRCRLYARLDDGRVTWTPRIKRRDQFPADTLATKMTLTRARAVCRSFSNCTIRFGLYEVMHENDV